MVFRVHVETCHALPRSKATETAVLHADFEMVSREEPSYFDEVLFLLLGSVDDANVWWAHPACRTSIETQQVDATEKAMLVIFYTRELAYQVKHEFDRFSKYLVKVKTGIIYFGCSKRVSRRS